MHLDLTGTRCHNLVPRAACFRAANVLIVRQFPQTLVHFAYRILQPEPGQVGWRQGSKGEKGSTGDRFLYWIYSSLSLHDVGEERINATKPENQHALAQFGYACFKTNYSANRTSFQGFTRCSHCQKRQGLGEGGAPLPPGYPGAGVNQKGLPNGRGVPPHSEGANDLRTMVAPCLLLEPHKLLVLIIKVSDIFALFICLSLQLEPVLHLLF